MFNLFSRKTQPIQEVSVPKQRQKPKAKASARSEPKVTEAAPDEFTEAEKEDIRAALREKIFIIVELERKIAQLEQARK